MNDPAVLGSLPDARSDRSGAVTARRRRAIIDAAIVIFAERGYEGASTREIAEAVGLKQGHLYYYFRAKQDLLFAIIDELHQHFLEGFERWVAGAPPGDALRAALAGHVAMVCRDHRAARVAYENARFLEPTLHDQIVAKRNRYEAAVAALVGARLGLAADSAGLVTRAVLGCVNWVYQWYSETGPLGPDQLAERLADLALATVDHATPSQTSPKGPSA